MTSRCIHRHSVRALTAAAFAVALCAAGPARAAADGKTIYTGKCAVCHGADGVAKEMWAKKGMRNLNDPAFQKEMTDAQMVKTTTEGIAEKKMPAFKDKLTPEEVSAVVQYVRSLAPAK